MPDPRIHQEIDFSIIQSANEWKLDVNLATPELVSPEDGTVVCPETGPGTSNIDLEWKAVSGASEYILQWCLNNNFDGPTCRAVRISTTTYTLSLVADIAMNDEVHWRVGAIDNAGGVSDISDTWSVKYECPSDAGGKGGGQSGGPKDAPTENKVDCQAAEVKIKIVAPNVISGKGKFGTRVQITWDCKNAFGEDLVVFLNGVWSVKHAGGVAIINQDNTKAVFWVDTDISQLIAIEYVATFTDLISGGQFVCREKREIFVDGDSCEGSICLESSSSSESSSASSESSSSSSEESGSVSEGGGDGCNFEVRYDFITISGCKLHVTHLRKTINTATCEETVTILGSDELDIKKDCSCCPSESSSSDEGGSVSGDSGSFGSGSSAVIDSNIEIMAISDDGFGIVEVDTQVSFNDCNVAALKVTLRRDGIIEDTRFLPQGTDPIPVILYDAGVPSGVYSYTVDIEEYGGTDPCAVDSDSQSYETSY